MSWLKAKPTTAEFLTYVAGRRLLFWKAVAVTLFQPWTALPGVVIGALLASSMPGVLAILCGWLLAGLALAPITRWRVVCTFDGRTLRIRNVWRSYDINVDDVEGVFDSWVPWSRWVPCLEVRRRHGGRVRLVATYGLKVRRVARAIREMSSP